jgi:predicted anti-sigma-YlaC factor YlaD
MRCHRYKKWISDNLDGELSKKKRERLDLHLRSCPSCLSYSARLKKIQEDAVPLKEAGLSEDYLKDFSLRLKTKISDLPSRQKSRLILNPVFQWGVAAASVIILACVSVLLFFPGIVQTKSGERFVFSMDDAVQVIRSDIGDDQELEELFNIMILASIENSLQDSNWREQPGFDEKLYEEQYISEGDLQQVEQDNGYDLKI